MVSDYGIEITPWNFLLFLLGAVACAIVVVLFLRWARGDGAWTGGSFAGSAMGSLLRGGGLGIERQLAVLAEDQTGFAR